MEPHEYYSLVIYDTPMSDAFLSNAEVSSLLREIILAIERFEVDAEHPNIIGVVAQYILLKMAEYHGRSQTELLVRRMLKATIHQEELPV